MYGGWKRLHTEDNISHQPIVTRKKRTQSAMLKNDKVVSKLLNISLLDSQIGGSLPVTS